MPLTLEGFGTMFYGESDVRQDRSFVTTEWVTLLHIPVLPLRSLRVRRDTDSDLNAIVLQSEGYAVVEPVPMAWGQIALIYFFLSFIFAWWYLSFVWCRPRIRRTLDGPDAWQAVFYVLLLATSFAAPFLVAWVVRKISSDAYPKKTA
jgi:hypothetical protein